MDWISALGGVSDILLKMIAIFIGGVSVFNSKFTYIVELFYVKSRSKITDSYKKQ